MTNVHPLAAVLAILILIALIAGVSSAGDSLFRNQASNHDQLQAEIESICNRWRASMLEDKDMAKVASFYADNAILVDDRGLYVGGRDAIDAYWDRVPVGKAWTITTYFVDGREGLVIQRGRSDLTVDLEAGERTFSVEFLHVWQRQDDGQLKIVVDSYWSANDPAQ